MFYFFFIVLPLIVFFIVMRAKATQAAEQSTPRQAETPPQPPEQPAPVRSVPKTAPAWVSPEGTASDEGECVEENPEHCAVEHTEESAYALDSAVALPRNELARAVVMSELLGKPVSLRGSRF